MFILVGSLGALIDFLIFVYLHKVLSWSPFFSNMISFHVAALLALIMHARLTFVLALNVKKIISAYSYSFFLLMYFNLLLSSVILWVGIHFIYMPSELVKLFSIATIAALSYVIQKKFIFNSA